MREPCGILCIGDPHIASRPPGFRRDDYPRAIVAKLQWCLDYARGHNLLPVILGDLFHYPRDNANWIVGELAAMFSVFTPAVLAVAGNHDLAENSLTRDDSLDILVRGGHLWLVDDRPWTGMIGGRSVVIGGTAWGQKLPEVFVCTAPPPAEMPAPAGGTPAVPTPVQATAPLVFWITHHDIRFTGHDLGRLDCVEIPGIDAVINGHIHRPLPEVIRGRTHWLNPGGITRVTRGDGSRARIPAALRIDIGPVGWMQEDVPVPHKGFDEVFHPQTPDAPLQVDESMFIAGLRQLETLRTASGAGLEEFLKKNLDQFDPPVAGEIRKLAQEVLHAIPDAGK